ncbi:hypothetical protein ACFVH4_18830 [Nocardia ignorata]|uniref:hypothetical protein n=1 Tax=Nocardia ignorata TaxID=145285 RepID=UPI003639C955
MTHQQYPTTREQIATTLTRDLREAGGDNDMVRAAIASADRSLLRIDLLADRSWLCEHYSHISHGDTAAVIRLGERLAERLTVEGDAVEVYDLTNRTLDALTRDVRNLITAGADPRGLVAALVEPSSGQTPAMLIKQLALLLNAATIRLAGFGRLLDELHDLRAQVAAQAEIEQAKREQIAAVQA